MFKPEEHKFYTTPTLYICAIGERFSIGFNDKKLADAIHSGVYAWTIKNKEEKIIPMYIGLYGKTAEKPSLSRRFRQHLGGLNSALAGNPPTPHWRDCLVPAAKKIVFDQKDIINVYFGHFNKNEILALEAQLIQMYRPEWNSRGL